jgi:hypothetical protein
LGSVVQVKQEDPKAEDHYDIWANYHGVIPCQECIKSETKLPLPKPGDKFPPGSLTQRGGLGHLRLKCNHCQVSCNKDKAVELIKKLIQEGISE